MPRLRSASPKIVGSAPWLAPPKWSTWPWSMMMYLMSCGSTPIFLIFAEKLNAVKGVQVYIMTHAWQDPNGYPGGGIHERAKKLASRKPGEPHPFVDPATWDARAKRQLESARKVLADEQAKAGATKAN
jgi:hypothetical protein